MADPEIRKPKDFYPLSCMQQGMLFNALSAPGTGLQVEQTTYAICGRLDVAAFGRAWQSVVDRHPVLRTTFVWSGLKEPVQVVRNEVVLPIEQDDWRAIAPDDQAQRLEAFLTADRARGFDLSSGPLLRLAVFRVAEEQYRFVFSCHHIILDGWSGPLLDRELWLHYEAAVNGTRVELPRPRPFRDYIGWLRRQDRVAAEKFWRETFAGFESGGWLTRSAGNSRGSHVSDSRGEQEVSLSGATSAALKSYVRRHRLTLNSVVQGAWALTVSRFSGEDDIAIGVVTSGRPMELLGADAMIGMFINTIPARVRLPAEATLVSWLGDLQAWLIEAQKFEHVGLAEIQQWCGRPGGLFDSLIVSHALPSGQSEAGARSGLTFGKSRYLTRVEYPLTVIVAPEAGLSLRLLHDETSVSGELATTLLRHFARAIDSIVRSEPTCRIRDVAYLDEDERRQVLVDWNATARDYPRDRTVVQLFEEQAGRRAGETALQYEGGSLTYGELNARADGLAARLRGLGVRPGVLVGLCVERTAALLVGLLGTLKAGGAYVPLDPAFPAQRLAFMLQDCGASVLLTQASLEGLLPVGGVQVVYLDRMEPGEIGGGGALPPVAGPDDLAYVLYTSGSTGRPKGVEVEHRALTNFLWSMRSEPGCGEGDALLAVTTLSFDIAGLELYLPLITGARVVLASREVAADGRRLAGYLEGSAATLMQATPATWRMLIDAGWQGSPKLTALVGGEALPAELVGPLLERTGALWNLYGPTETTIWSSVQRVMSAGEQITVGRPIANTTFYIVDRALQPVPIGVSGELLIGGEGLARGYRGRAELTAEKFIGDAFSGEAGARLYRTGDLARYRADGQVVHLGRLDQQVKVRGFRIELGEIEAALAGCPGVGQAVVAAREDTPGGAALAAYVVAQPGCPVSGTELRQHLRQSLPEYMVPQYFVQIEALPLTPNGKIDRKALPAPERGADDPGQAFVAPRTPTEREVAAIFAELLQLERVGVHSDFFDLGGHSLLAIRLMSRLGTAFAVELPLQVMFEAPTVGALAQRVGQALGSGVALPALRPAVRGGALPLSFAQQRLWFLDRLEGGGAVYNIPMAYRLAGALDVAALERSLDEIVRRHEVLRTTFAQHDGVPVQVIAPAMKLRCEVVEAPAGMDRREALQRWADQEARRPFVLATGPLIRAGLFRVAHDEHVLVLTMHHIVSDGWSVEVLWRELHALYDAFRQGLATPLPELPIQYADYAVWQREQLTDAALQGQRAYWKERLAHLATLELPTDRPRPKVQTYVGAWQPIALPHALTAALDRVGRGQRATLFMTLIGAFQVLLGRYSGQDDVAVGIPVANRGRSELEDLIGFFVNTLVLRTDLSGDPAFVDLLARVREATQGAMAHQDLPFEKLVEEVNAARDLSRNPLFQVLFSMQGLPAPALPLGDLAASSMPIDLGISKFDLSVYLGETAGELHGFIEYNTDLFDAQTIERLVGHYRRLLEAIVANPSARVSELALLTTDERRQVLVDWNATARDYPRDRTVVQLFEEQAGRRAGETALQYEGGSLTYGELNARADGLAARLRGLGVRPGVLVGLCVERTAALLVGLLGTLKAGGAYVPLDPAFPAQRLAFMLQDCGASVLLTQASLEGLLPVGGVQVVYLDRMEPGEIGGGGALPPVAGPDDLAYVLYTSGSTGRPKGVEVEHRALTNFLWSMRSEPGCGEGDALLAVTTLSFDIAGLELYLPLITGARVVLASREVAADGRRLAGYLEGSAATLMQATPATWRMLIDAGWQGSPKLTALVGGEALPAELVGPLLERTGALWNLYGPTETTIWSSVQRVMSAGEQITVGRPIANTTFYIVDRALQPVPIGVSGELLIGGEGLARGYRGRAELTAEKFIGDAFSGEAGARLYRTGDLARYRADGQVVHLGRLDQQVKVRGFRIELGEIEAALAGCPGVGQAVVAAREDTPGGAALVAYVVAQPGCPVSGTELRQHLRQSLPEYMVPQYFVQIEALPLTPNGKIDRKALPVPTAHSLHDSHGHAAAQLQTPSERLIAGVWSELLGVAALGPDDNFFDLGGHSMLAMQAIARIEKLTGTRLGPQRFILESLGQLAHGLDAAAAARPPPSGIVRRLWRSLGRG